MHNFLSFYQNKKVLVTGHTGFKGTWLCKILCSAGAQVTGFALAPNTQPNLFNLVFPQASCDDVVHQDQGSLTSIIGDIRDLELLKQTFAQVQPEIVFHLAAQPIVRASYLDPVGTYSTNVMGTVHVLECVRLCPSVRSVINITTDKVYQNQEWTWGYRENDLLDGREPYSNSKSCSELVSACYKRSYFDDLGIPLSTLRAGNVIGGGDFAPFRIIPDCIRSAIDHKPIEVRNPYSVRPYQHVLEPLMAYLMVGYAQYHHHELASSYNVGPDESDCWTTGQLADLFCKTWGNNLSWQHIPNPDQAQPLSYKHVPNPHQAQNSTHKSSNTLDNIPDTISGTTSGITSGNIFAPNSSNTNSTNNTSNIRMIEHNLLRLDCSKLKSTFGWRPVWHLDEALRQTVAWTKCYLEHGDIAAEMMREIHSFLAQLKDIALTLN